MRAVFNRPSISVILGLDPRIHSVELSKTKILPFGREN